MGAICGLLFDKDGTLFNFQASWGAFCANLIEELAAGEPVLMDKLSASIGYDLRTSRFSKDSPIIAGTNFEIAAVLARHLPDMTIAAIIARLNALGAGSRMVEAVPLIPLFDDFRNRGLFLGLATNDGEMPARAHLEQAGLTDHFHFVSGFDSGHGGKPEPGMLLAFAAACRLRPDEVAMVGDSLHDLVAGRAAGMATVGVLTGIADAQDLAAMADVVLPDIGHLPRWLNSRIAAR